MTPNRHAVDSSLGLEPYEAVCNEKQTVGFYYSTNIRCTHTSNFQASCSGGVRAEATLCRTCFGLARTTISPGQLTSAIAWQKIK